MSNPLSYRPEPGAIPTDPGVYTFRDASGRVIYVGKAKNLRARLSNYFQDLSQLHPRTRTMVTTATAVQWTVVASEVEALNLEYTWIKRFNPRYNVMYRDDKTYPMLALSVKDAYPRAFVYRGPRRRGVRYFGPYPKAWAIRETLETLTRIFPVRTCTTGVFNRHQALGRPCLLGYIDRCSAPCVGNISEADHRGLVDDLSRFLSGNTEPVRQRIEAEMMEAAEDLDFERATVLRDQLGAISKAMEKQAVVMSDSTDADLIALVTDELEAAVQIFHVRRGRIHGQQGWIVERDGATDEQLIGDFITQFYGETAELTRATETAVGGSRGAAVDRDLAAAINPAATAELGDLVGDVQNNPIPKEVLVDLPSLLDDAATPGFDPAALSEWLTTLRGSHVALRVPQRGDKKALMDTARTNASQALARHKLARAGDITARSAALQEIQQALWMDDSPLRIECIDISHTQGTDVVASMVVFEDGLAKKSDYRRFQIREAAGAGHSDDVASIAEVVRRRFARAAAEQAAAKETPADQPAGDEAPRRFAYPPNLLLIDGGKPQVNAAQAVLDDLGITDIAVAGIAKRLEELWVPGDEYPVIMARTSPGLYLIQQIRDEAHRFAITYHRRARSARMTHSVLDDIKGLGKTRRTQLIKEFGSVAKIKEASVTDIAAVPGFGKILAQTVYDALHPELG